MSLRYKALFGVVVLVAVLTSVLVVSSGSRFESEARARIQRELSRDALYLEAQLRAVERNMRTALEGSAESSQLVHLLNVSRSQLPELRDNLAPFAGQWLEDAQGDLAFAALDAFDAEDRGATLLGEIGKDLQIVAARARSEEPLEQILSDTELAAFVDRFYSAHFDAEPVDLQPTHAAVLPVAGAVYLVAQSYLYSSIQQRSVVGVGVVMVEINDLWLARNLPRLPDEINPVEKLVFSGRLLSAGTLPAATARALLEGMNQRRDDEDRLEIITDQGTYLGLNISSPLIPLELKDPPRFMTLKSLDRELQPFVEVRSGVFLLAAILGAAAALLAYVGTYTVIHPLRRLQDATVRVRQGEFETRVLIKGRDEVARLGQAFNDMTTGLKALGLYTHETLARGVMDNPELLSQSSARETGSVFFSDIAGFTSIAENMDAQAITQQLNEYFSKLGEALRGEKGYVDKFIGDAIMAYWGPPFIKDGEFAVRALTAALLCVDACRDLRRVWSAEGKPLFYQRIGIATGDVVIGTIGTDSKKNFTVIGDCVNLASRLEGANKFYGTEILVDERTRELAHGRVLFREVDQIRVAGRRQTVRVFEPLTLAGTGVQPSGRNPALYERALTRYRAGEFDAAIEMLDDILRMRPDDGPSKWLRRRCQELSTSPPDPHWQPVTSPDTK